MLGGARIDRVTTILQDATPDQLQKVRDVYCNLKKQYSPYASAHMNFDGKEYDCTDLMPGHEIARAQFTSNSLLAGTQTPHIGNGVLCERGELRATGGGDNR